MRLLILAAAAALASSSGTRAQGPPQANCAAQAPHSLSLHFADNQAALTPQAQAMLAEAAKVAQACPTLILTIIAYPGDSGAAAADQMVATRRLTAITAALGKLGVTGARLRLITGGAAAGPAAPFVTGATIDFTVQGPPAAARQFHYLIRPGVASSGPFARSGPPPQAESFVGSLPKGPLVTANGAGAAGFAAPPPPNAGAPANPGPAPGFGPPANTGAPPTPGPAPNSGPPAQAPKLTVQYNAPASIPLGQDTDYRLIIQSGHPTAAGDFAGAPGPLASHKIPTLTWARAVMTGPQDQVTVQPQSAPCQEVTSQDNPTWDWAVTPKSNRPFYLTVDIYEVANCNDVGQLDHRVDTFPIRVTETFWSWLVYEWPAWKSALAWVLATIAAVGGAFGAWTWLKPNKPAGS